MKFLLILTSMLSAIVCHASDDSMKLEFKSQDYTCSFDVPQDLIWRLAGWHWEQGVSKKEVEKVKKKIESDIEYRIDALLLMKLHKKDSYDYVIPKEQQLCFGAFLLTDLLNYKGQKHSIYNQYFYSRVKDIYELNVESRIITKLFNKIEKKSYLKKTEFIDLSSLSDNRANDYYLKVFKVREKYLKMSFGDKVEIYRAIREILPRTSLSRFALENFDYKKFYADITNSLDQDFEERQVFPGADLYWDVIRNLDIKDNLDLLKTIVEKTKSRNKLIAFLALVSPDFLKSDFLESDKCRLGQKIADRFSEADITKYAQDVLEKIFDLKIDCINTYFNSKEIYSINDSRYFAKWCIDKASMLKCKLYFSADWIKKVKACKIDNDCTSKGQPFHFNKVTSANEVTYYLENQDKIISDLFGMKEEPGDSICFEQQCQADLPICETNALFKILLSKLIKREDNKCTSNADCRTIPIHYNPDNETNLYLPIASKNFANSEIDHLYLNFWERFIKLKNLCRPDTKEKKNKRKEFYENFKNYKAVCENNYCQMTQ